MKTRPSVESSSADGPACDGQRRNYGMTQLLKCTRATDTVHIMGGSLTESDGR